MIDREMIEKRKAELARIRPDAEQAGSTRIDPAPRRRPRDADYQRNYYLTHNGRNRRRIGPARA